MNTGTLFAALLTIVVGAYFVWSFAIASRMGATCQQERRVMDFEPVAPHPNRCLDCIGCGDRMSDYDNELERKTRALAQTSFMG